MKRKIIRVSGLLLIGWLGLFLCSCAYTPAYHHLTKENRTSSISEMKWVKIGGLKQSIQIRGQNRENPILLFIHGGPGRSEMPLTRCFNPALEKDFIVVNWDQRGSGRTNRVFKPVKDFKLESYLDDTYEVICFLKEYLGKEKVFILGHSWGSLLGILTAARHPEAVYAYIGMGQVVGSQENIAQAADIAIDLALEKQDQTALENLNRLKINNGELSTITNQDIIYLGKFLIKNTNQLSKKKIYNHLVWRALWSAEYSVIDILRYLNGMISAKTFLEQNNIKELDLYKMVPELKVPLFVMIGMDDIFTNRNVTRAYFDFVQAPLKEFYLFDHSSHFPVFEEVENFNRILLRDIRPLSEKVP